METKLGCIRDDVGPWGRRPLISTEQSYVLAATLMKATQTIKKRQFRRRQVGFGIDLRRLSWNQERRQWFLHVRSIKLLLQSSALTNDNCAGDGMEQYA